MRVLVAVLLVASLLAGCAGRTAPCREGTPAEGETGVCFVSDNWILRGAVRGDTGPVILLVHGDEEDRTSFDRLSTALAANGTRVLSFDLRGHGETSRGGDKGDPRTFTTDEWRAMLKDVARAERFAKERWGEGVYAIVGSAVGSSIGLKYAATNQTPAVVLLSPGLNYKGFLLQEFAPNYHGRVYVLASARDAASAESAEDMRARMKGASEFDGRTVAGGAHGTALVQDPGNVALVVDFITRS